MFPHEKIHKNGIFSTVQYILTFRQIEFLYKRLVNINLLHIYYIRLGIYFSEVESELVGYNGLKAAGNSQKSTALQEGLDNYYDMQLMCYLDT